MIPVQILDHFDEAKQRLVSQFRGKPKVEAFLASICLNIDDLEVVLFDLKDARSIYNAEGIQLDQLGTLLSQKRAGLGDELYRIVLLAKIAQNVSKGTADDLIIIFKLLMQADYVDIQEQYPAGLTLISIGGSPIGNIEDIKNAVRRAASAGVSVDLFASVAGNAFSFAEDPDPNGRGFGDLNNPSLGGYFSSIF